jgi:hypothetical protein
LTPSSEDLRAWARAQTRVTNYTLRRQYGVSYDEADALYKQLKADGVIGTLGYVFESC